MRVVDLVGQIKMKCMIYGQIIHCLKTGSVFPHSILIASAGSGKSTFANAIADEIGGRTIQAFGPSLQTESDIANIFFDSKGVCSLKQGDVVFIDEIHAIPMKAAEHLYTLMENFSFVRNGQKLSIPRFTLLAGTTEPHMMPKPLRDRFIHTFVLEPYTTADIAEFVKKDEHVKINSTTLYEKLGRLCRFNPRLLKSFRVKMSVYASVINKQSFDDADWPGFLSFIGYTNLGLTSLEDKYMRILSSYDKASLNTMANLLSLKPTMVASIIEPSLLSAGLIELAVGGRKLTEEGRRHYGQRGI